VCNVDINAATKHIDGKKCYIFDNVCYYKVVGRNATYYIKVSDYHNVTLSQKAITLYEKTLHGLMQIKSYIKSMGYSDILFIAAPSITSSFSMFNLEKSN
jgi:cyanophycinase-like exopeptidase